MLICDLEKKLGDSGKQKASRTGPSILVVAIWSELIDDSPVTIYFNMELGGKVFQLLVEPETSLPGCTPTSINFSLYQLFQWYVVCMARVSDSFPVQYVLFVHDRKFKFKRENSCLLVAHMVIARDRQSKIMSHARAHFYHQC